MSYFSAARLRRLREANRLSIVTVHEMTGVSVSAISNIETGKTDPRMSTVVQLLSCYGAGLADLEPRTPDVVGLEELKRRSARAAEDLVTSGLGPSDPNQRLARKDGLGLDTSVERGALATRS